MSVWHNEEEDKAVSTNEDYAALANEIVVLRDRIDRLRGDVGDTIDRRERAQGRLLRELGERITAVFDEMTEQLDEVNTRVEELTERVNNNEDDTVEAVCDLRDDLRRATSEELMKALREGLDAVREEIRLGSATSRVMQDVVRSAVRDAVNAFWASPPPKKAKAEYVGGPQAAPT